MSQDSSLLASRKAARQVLGREDDVVSWLCSPDVFAVLEKESGIPIESLGVEARVDGGRADMLCTDARNGSTVVVEVQLGMADDDHVGRLLGYCREYDASAGILVAEGFPGSVVDLQERMSKSRQAAISLRLVGMTAYKSQVGQEFVSMARVRDIGNGLGRRRVSAPLSSPVAMENVTDIAEVENVLYSLLDGATAKACLAELQDSGVQDSPNDCENWLFARWPSPADQSAFVQTLSAGLCPETSLVVVLISDVRSDTKRHLLDLVATGVRTKVLLAKTGGSGRVSARVVDPLQLAQKDVTHRCRESRIEFWDKVASTISPRTATKMRKRVALGRSSHGLTYNLGRRGARLAALRCPRTRKLCVEVRFQGIEEVLAKNQYGQLKRIVGDGDHFSHDFDVQWRGHQPRLSAYVLRLAWRGGRANDEGDYQHVDAKLFAMAMLNAEHRLAKAVSEMAEFRW